MKFHIFHLMEKHQSIDSALRAEQIRSAPDPWRIQQLKRMKLAIKERLNAFAERPLAHV